jgi:hypothetical protein
MTKGEIITKFTLYLDDQSELSSQEASDLFDKIYRKINASRPWEGTKKEGTGTQSTSVPYVSLATDFLYLTQNKNFSRSGEYAYGPVVLVGAQYTPYQVVSWSDRRQYRDKSGYAYIDLPNSRLYFTLQPVSADSVEYDYHSQMPALATGDTPWFPEEFHDAIYHGMCVDDFVIQQSDKAKSYQNVHEKQYADYLTNMAYWNSRLIQEV